MISKQVDEIRGKTKFSGYLPLVSGPSQAVPNLSYAIEPLLIETMELGYNITKSIINVREASVTFSTPGTNPLTVPTH